MVNIKEGYVMTAAERAEYERMNALPRKPWGRVDYYFKRETKYPARIYVFMHAEIWCDRNRRPMGLYHSLPFLSRPMNSEELEYHHFDSRLCYHQYEHWAHLLAAEQQEATLLDAEQLGAGTKFMEALLSYQSKYTIGAQSSISSLNCQLKQVSRSIADRDEKDVFRQIDSTLIKTYDNQAGQHDPQSLRQPETYSGQLAFNF